MLILNLELPDNIYSEMMLECSDIPCLVKIDSNFIIDFFETVPLVSGYVLEWSWYDLNERIPAGAGGDYLYYKRSLITLDQIDNKRFNIIGLSMFVNGVGWCKVIENGQYANPNPELWDIDPDE
ncbi:hypothetical protein KTJ16_20875 [Acinetobacter bereziniae]|nr:MULTISPECIES: hypothetical protein [Acinetobacter]ATZ64497.1 hypothetical protein BSR55_14660 [Acinetobacter bereziniae]ELW87508.1 hypothetical protein ACINWC743_A0706 [Acinetobacter sp. WC-743]MBJ8424116.1 hypothetical protein [Acinetobacter bereziniae]MBJ8427986.1 hypothetical protein [Acinetobacter bereziniae]MBJ8477116.1 hypothetical protein [Acinetobacter bereziniae]